MNKTHTTLAFTVILTLLLSSCSRSKLDPKGFSVEPISEEEDDDGIIDGFNQDSIDMKTRPGHVLLTGYPQYRLTTVFKVNINKKSKRTFIGSNSYHRNYRDVGRDRNNNWNYHYMPGLEALYGYNIVNVSLHDTASEKHKKLFKKPILMRTLYFPAFESDTLNNVPVKRDYYLVSAYDEDTNNDGYINLHDLRRFYYFNLDGEQQTSLVPKNYSVMSSQYDHGNDRMFVYARHDANENGKTDDLEEIKIFWIDLKNPLNTGRQY